MSGSCWRGWFSKFRVHVGRLCILEFQMLDITSDLDHKFQRTGCFSQSPPLVLIFTKLEEHWCIIFSLVRLELIFKYTNEVVYLSSTFD